MKKNLTLAVLLVFIGAAAEVSAQKWFKVLDFIGDSYSFLRGPWYGQHRSVQLFDKQNKVVQTFREPLVCQISPAGITSVGKVDNTDPQAFVNDMIQIDGETYICLNYWEVGLLPRLHKLNKQTKEFQPVADLRFDREFKFHYLDNGRFLFFGGFYSAQDKNGSKVFNGNCIWDSKTNTLDYVYPLTATSLYKTSSEGADGSVSIISAGGLNVMVGGDSMWSEKINYPAIPGGQFKQVLGLSKDNLYTIWQRDADRVNLLLHWKNKGWETISEISYPGPVATQSVSLDFVVSSLEHYKGKLIMSHTGSQIDGKAAGPIMVYDTTTKVWSPLPVPWALGTRNKFGESYVKIVGDSIYLVQDPGDLIFGVQTVWLLEHDGLLPIVLKNFSGSSESGTHKLFWESEIEQNFSHFEIQASKEGAVFETVRNVQGKGLGTYTQEFKTNARTFYRLKMVDKDGLFRYSGVVVLNAPIVSGRAYPNPTTGSVLVEVKSQGTLEVLDITGKKLQRQNVSPGTYQINLSSYAKGMYLIQLFVEGTLQTTHKILKN